MDTYLEQMQPVPSPYLVDGELSEAARRGQEVFQKAGCSNCHPEPLFTDLQKYDVGTGTERDAGLKFDTPTLIEIWRTGPYLVRGQAKSIMEVLTEYNKDDKHGKTSDLSEQELRDLAEYVLSL
jgi:cytochrome c peroxidase